MLSLLVTQHHNRLNFEYFTNLQRFPKYRDFWQTKNQITPGIPTTTFPKKSQNSQENNLPKLGWSCWKWMDQWFGSMGEIPPTFGNGVFLGVITHLLTIDPNFQQDIKEGSPSFSFVIAIGWQV